MAPGLTQFILDKRQYFDLHDTLFAPVFHCLLLKIKTENRK